MRKLQRRMSVKFGRKGTKNWRTSGIVRGGDRRGSSKMVRTSISVGGKNVWSRCICISEDIIATSYMELAWWFAFRLSSGLDWGFTRECMPY